MEIARGGAGLVGDLARVFGVEVSDHLGLHAGAGGEEEFEFLGVGPTRDVPLAHELVDELHGAPFVGDPRFDVHHVFGGDSAFVDADLAEDFGMAPDLGTVCREVGVEDDVAQLRKIDREIDGGFFEIGLEDDGM